MQPAASGAKAGTHAPLAILALGTTKGGPHAAEADPELSELEEARRLGALLACRQLDTPPERRFDTICTLLQSIFQAGLSGCAAAPRGRLCWRPLLCPHRPTAGLLLLPGIDGIDPAAVPCCTLPGIDGPAAVPCLQLWPAVCGRPTQVPLHCRPPAGLPAGADCRRGPYRL